MISFGEIPGIVIHPVESGPEAGRRELVVEVREAAALDPKLETAIDATWAELRRANPRLHDGGILLAEMRGSASPPAGRDTGKPAASSEHLIARRAKYKTLATAARMGLDVRALGVQGIVTGRDRDEDEHLLLGRRSSEVRIYQGLWENAPSGTVSPPPAGRASIDLTYFLRALVDEGLEETGLDLERADVSWIALLEDAEAQSLDAVLKLDMRMTIDPRGAICPADDSDRWEYGATAWVPVAQLSDWAARHAHAVSPPTRAVIRWLCEPRTQ